MKYFLITFILCGCSHKYSETFAIKDCYCVETSINCSICK